MPHDHLTASNTQTFSASVEEVLDSLFDPVRLASASGEPGAFPRASGASVSVLGGVVSGTMIAVSESGFTASLKAPYLPKAARPLRIEVTIRPSDGGCELRLDQWVTYESDGPIMSKKDSSLNYAVGFKGRPFWQDRFLAPLAATFLPGWRPEVASAAPEDGPGLIAWIGEAGTWPQRLRAMAGAQPIWWNSTTGEQRGLEAWSNGLARFGRTAEVRVAVACARLALPTLTAAKRNKAAKEAMAEAKEAGARPSAEQIALAERWTARPTVALAKEVRAAVDVSRQLRYFEEEFEGCKSMRWALAFEAAEAAARAVEDSGEAMWAALCTLECLRGDEPLSDRHFEALHTAIAGEVVPWARHASSSQTS